MSRETNEELPADLAASLARGLADSAAGRVHDAGDFTQYAEGGTGMSDTGAGTEHVRFAGSPEAEREALGLTEEEHALGLWSELRWAWEQIQRIRAAEFVLVGEWLAQRVDGCTCAGGDLGGYGHENGCGLEPVQTVPSLLAAARTGRRIEALFSGGPDTACRTVWQDGIECVSVPIADLRAALGTEQEGQQ